MSFRLVTINDIKQDTFQQASRTIMEALDYDKPLNLLVGSPMGSGKSSWTDEIAVKIAAKGKNVLIAVPSGDVAKEHKERIEKNGGSAHLLQSHKGTFKDREDDCPDYENIQYLYNLGVDSSVYKKEYCKNCPLFSSCAYPSQYVEAKNEDRRIVIIQHAHFRCRETLVQLFADKTFHVMIIDESFIDSLVDTIYPTEFEIETLKTFDFKWSQSLATWMDVGGEAKGTLRPRQGELEDVQKVFKDNSQPWRIRTLLDAYNQGEFLHAKSGIKIFSPLPYIGIKVLTDATPTEDELKIVLNSSDLKVIGKNDILDIRRYHPENEIIQVIDSSLSKSSLLKDEKYYDILNYIGESATTKYKEDRILITTFKDKEDFKWSTEAVDYLRLKWPDLDVGTDPLVNRLVVNGMKVGVNTYADFTIQFLISSVYMSPYQIASGAYKIKLIRNFWRRQEGLDIINNILPTNNIQGLDSETIPVRKIEPDGVFEYPDIQLRVPANKFERMAYEKNVGKSQQAIRIRFTRPSAKRKKVYVFGNYNFPSVLITSTRLLESILAVGPS